MYPFPLQNDAGNQPFVQSQSGLSGDEISRIREIGDSLEKAKVKLYGEFDDSDVKASGSRFPLNDETRWIYDRMATAIYSINHEKFRYCLTGIHETLYYLTYRAGDHFNWHLDQGGETPAPRKLSLILQLSDPSEYEGGEFDVMVGAHHVMAGKAKGMITAFPSFKIHRVRPVTSGVRRALTAFAVGPSFR